MGPLANGLLQGALILCLLGLLGLPYFVWRRPPVYYWRCPACGGHNNLASPRCDHCRHTVLRDDMHECVRADWRARDLIALYLSAQVISLTAGALLVLALGRVPSGDLTLSDVKLLASDPEVVWLLVLLMGATRAVLTAWMLSARYRWPVAEVGLHMHDAGRNVLRGIAVGVAAFGLGIAVSAAASLIPFFAEEQSLLLARFPARVEDPLWLPILASMLVVGPISGELFFRGMLYTTLRARFSVPRAAIFAAVLFVLGGDPVTQYLPLLVPLFLLGIGNGLLLERTRSLLPGVVASASLGLLIVASVVVTTALVAG